MAERSVEAELEGLRREAVAAIANGGNQAAGAVNNISGAINRAGKSVMADQSQAASRYNIPGLEAELASIIQPALAGREQWASEQGAFERADTASRQTSAGNFFEGARTALPIVQSQADATRAAAEAQLLNQALQQELQAGQMGFGFKQAIEQRQAAREAAAFQRQQALQQQAFQQQAHNESLALQREQLAFQEREAARLAAAASAPPPAPAPSRAPAPSGRSWGSAMAGRSRSGWGR